MACFGCLLSQTPRYSLFNSVVKNMEISINLILNIWNSFDTHFPQYPNWYQLCFLALSCFQQRIHTHTALVPTYSCLFQLFWQWSELNLLKCSCAQHTVHKPCYVYPLLKIPPNLCTFFPMVSNMVQNIKFFQSIPSNRHNTTL